MTEAIRPEVLEQARTLHETVRLLRDVFLRRHIAQARDENGDEDWLNLTLPQMNTLLLIRRQGQMTIKEIAEGMRVSAPSASAMVERLVETGVLMRQRSREDRREVRVFFSPRGEKAIDAMEQQMLRSIAELLLKLEPECAQKWCEVYAQIREVLLAEEQPAPVTEESN